MTNSWNNIHQIPSKTLMMNSNNLPSRRDGVLWRVIAAGGSTSSIAPRSLVRGSRIHKSIKQYSSWSKKFTPRLQRQPCCKFSHVRIELIDLSMIKDVYVVFNEAPFLVVIRCRTRQDTIQGLVKRFFARYIDQIC